MLTNLNMLVVGAGSMGSSLIKGWAQAGMGPGRFTVVTPHESSVHELRKLMTIDWYEKAEDLPADFKPDVVVFAVKPQVIDAIIKSYFGYALQKVIFITVAAGKLTEFYRKHLGETVSIIRVMPNLPVAYGKGMSVGYAESFIPDQDLRLVKELFSVLGEMIWVDQEDKFHAVTAVSGCGPAYLYLMVKALMTAGVVAGLSPENAETMARQTMIGAAELLAHTDESMDVLIKKVASPGGVTEAALSVLEELPTGLIPLMTRAITTGVTRSKELSNDKN